MSTKRPPNSRGSTGPPLTSTSTNGESRPANIPLVHITHTPGAIMNFKDPETVITVAIVVLKAAKEIVKHFD